MTDKDARIAELEADLKLSQLVANEQRERAYKLESKLFVPPRPIGTHCGWCGRGPPGGAPPLADRIAALEAEKKRAFDALAILGVPQGRARSVSNGIDVLSARFRKADMAQSATIAALEAELAVERERREAAEALLRSGYTTAELIAHFARYKD